MHHNATGDVDDGCESNSHPGTAENVDLGNIIDGRGIRALSTTFQKWYLTPLFILKRNRKHLNAKEDQQPRFRLLHHWYLSVNIRITFMDWDGDRDGFHQYGEVNEDKSNTDKE